VLWEKLFQHILMIMKEEDMRFSPIMKGLLRNKKTTFTEEWLFAEMSDREDADAEEWVSESETLRPRRSVSIAR